MSAKRAIKRTAIAEPPITSTGVGASEGESAEAAFRLAEHLVVKITRTIIRRGLNVWVPSFCPASPGLTLLTID